jgi:hypothetical protein
MSVEIKFCGSRASAVSTQLKAAEKVSASNAKRRAGFFTKRLPLDVEVSRILFIPEIHKV